MTFELDIEAHPSSTNSDDVMASIVQRGRACVIERGSCDVGMGFLRGSSPYCLSCALIGTSGGNVSRFQIAAAMTSVKGINLCAVFKHGERDQRFDSSKPG